MFVLPSVVEQNVKRKPGLDLGNLPKTVFAGTNEELEQEDLVRHGG